MARLLLDLIGIWTLRLILLVKQDVREDSRHLLVTLRLGNATWALVEALRLRGSALAKTLRMLHKLLLLMILIQGMVMKLSIVRQISGWTIGVMRVWQIRFNLILLLRWLILAVLGPTMTLKVKAVVIVRLLGSLGMLIS